MQIRATVLSNIVCKNEQEKQKRENPRYGSIRCIIEAVKMNGEWLAPDQAGILPEIDKVKTILEISYEINVEWEKEYYLVCELQPKDRVELTIANEDAFYLKKNHLSVVKDRVLSQFVKIMGNADNISWVEHNPENLSEPPLAIASSELIQKLVWKPAKVQQGTLV